jgi:hypothetical protein
LSQPCALPRRHDAIALARAGAEHTVVPDEMEARRRDERGELLDPPSTTRTVPSSSRSNIPGTRCMARS